MRKSTSSWLIILLTFTLIAIFCKLGFWQLKRAEVKEQLQHTWQQRQTQPPVQSLTDQDDSLQFRRGQLTGHWLLNYWILLDNKIHQKKLGYEVYAVFKPEHFDGGLLVNLGFTPQLKNRKMTPTLPKLPSATTVIHGFFSVPPRYFALGNMLEKSPAQQPLIVQYINLTELEQALHIGKIHQHVFVLNKNPSIAREPSWVSQSTSPEKNRGYALQWFAMALTLLLLFLTLFFKKNKQRNST